MTKYSALIVAAFLVLLSLGLLASSARDIPSSQGLEKSSLRIGTLSIPVEIARTDAERARGLSGRMVLPENEGMLFVFERAGMYQFWMPEMRFPIDILWIENGKVVGITPNISNEFDPKNPMIYSPPSPVRSVLEVNAGFAEKHGIRLEDAVALPYLFRKK